MRRLTGIGVSPGIVCGRAVILIQRAQVLRYQIAPARLEHELARLEQSRVRTREQLLDIRARVARRRGPELAALFDAQLLMLDDPMLVPRAADARRASSASTPSGPSSRSSTSSAPCSTRSPTPTCGSARATSPTWSAGCG